jgi:hypothetical protein
MTAGLKKGNKNAQDKTSEIAGNILGDNLTHWELINHDSQLDSETLKPSSIALDDNSDLDEDLGEEWEEHNEILGMNLAEMARKLEEKEKNRDPDWIPAHLLRKEGPEKGAHATVLKFGVKLLTIFIPG